MKVGIIQQTGCANAHDNQCRIAEKVKKLTAEGAELIVNQELHDGLYFCQTENVDTCGMAVSI
ncbi:MAG: acyltransferase, partial [Muribaculaceae bacterium]|nr:acyltransferase [Muribaculaceae bacterium]